MPKRDPQRPDAFKEMERSGRVNEAHTQHAPGHLHRSPARGRGNIQPGTAGPYLTPAVAPKLAVALPVIDASKIVSPSKNAFSTSLAKAAVQSDALQPAAKSLKATADNARKLAAPAAVASSQTEHQQLQRISKPGSEARAGHGMSPRVEIAVAMHGGVTSSDTSSPHGGVYMAAAPSRLAVPGRPVITLNQTQVARQRVSTAHTSSAAGCPSPGACSSVFIHATFREDGLTNLVFVLQLACADACVTYCKSCSGSFNELVDLMTALTILA